MTNGRGCRITSPRPAVRCAAAPWSPSTGIRPRIVGPGEAAADFRIQGAAEHGWTGLVNLYGIESLGLTASLAIADEVAALLRVGAD
jgi:L-2-hydroxyglutarate oxidase LhgO